MDVLPTNLCVINEFNLHGTFKNNTIHGIKEGNKISFCLFVCFVLFCFFFCTDFARNGHLCNIYFYVIFPFVNITFVQYLPQMLDHDCQVPLSSPYPGLEEYYEPFNETMSSPEPLSGQDHQGESPDIPSWAYDVGGWCWLKKELTVSSP